MLPFNYAETLKGLVDRLLDKGFDQVAGQVLSAIDRNVNSGVMSTRQQQLDTEMKRLAAADEKLTADNPVLRAYLADFADSLKGSARQINLSADTLLQNAIVAANQIVPQAALAGNTVGVHWNQPDPEAIRSIMQYTTDPAWDAMLSTYQTGIAQQVSDIALNGVIQGLNPRQIGRNLSNAVNSIPQYQAQTLMRTLQLTGYRDAQVAHGVANADILQGQIRIAVLDGRTCMSCVALHGTEMAIDDRVDDHYNGRCTSVFIVKGRDFNVQSGDDWFNNQSDEQQRQMMGGAAYDAWQAGTIDLSDFVHKTTDPLFGDMVQQASLRGMLGDAASDYYQN